MALTRVYLCAVFLRVLGVPCGEASGLRVLLAAEFAYLPGMSETTPPYAGLTPDLILNAIDSTGFRTDGRLLALNSYENRVYQVGIEDEKPLVAKFYRPARWTDEQILEEHAFTA